MDDILASIRRILAEDSDPEQVAEAQEPEPVRRQAEPGEPRVETTSEPPKMAAPLHAEQAASVAAAGMPQRTPERRPEEESVLKQEPASERERADDIFELTPRMKMPEEHVVVSNPAADSVTDILSQLASAILQRRDIAVGAREVTLEAMVRSMLRPLLKEWLDRNLPYLIERLVKREIDLMVNRAERLE